MMMRRSTSIFLWFALLLLAAAPRTGGAGATKEAASAAKAARRAHRGGNHARRLSSFSSSSSSSSDTEEVMIDSDSYSIDSDSEGSDDVGSDSYSHISGDSESEESDDVGDGEGAAADEREEAKNRASHGGGSPSHGEDHRKRDDDDHRKQGPSTHGEGGGSHHRPQDKRDGGHGGSGRATPEHQDRHKGGRGAPRRLSSSSFLSSDEYDGSSDVGDGEEGGWSSFSDADEVMVDSDSESEESDDVGDGVGARADEREAGRNRASHGGGGHGGSQRPGGDDHREKGSKHGEGGGPRPQEHRGHGSGSHGGGSPSDKKQHGGRTPLGAKGGKIPLSEINQKNAAASADEQGEGGGSNTWPEFLSATLNMRLNPVPSTMNSIRQTIFATAVTRFLNKVFDGQSTYDIAVRSVNVIRQDRGSAEASRGRERNRRLSSGIRMWVRRGLGADGDEEIPADDDDKQKKGDEETAADDDKQKKEKPEKAAKEAKAAKAERAGGGVDTLDVELVIAAQYVEANSKKSLTNEDFGKLLLRIFNKFEEHLIQYMRDLEQERFENGVLSPEEVYFGTIEDVLVESYLAAVTEAAQGVNSASHGGEDGLDTTLIIAIVFGALGLCAFVAAIFIKLSWEGKLGMGGKKKRSNNNKSSSFDKDEYNIQDIVHNESFAYSTNEEIIKSMGSSGSGKSKKKKKGRAGIFRKKVGNDSKGDEFEEKISKYDMSARYGISESDEDNDVGEGQQKSPPSSPTNTRLSTDESVLQTEMERVARRREFTAPPGKLGVAIDSVNGHPVVHRIKEGSPLVGVLQRLDRIVAIDGTDTSSMSAADVTYLMVKGMNKPRRIAYIREE